MDGLSGETPTAIERELRSLNMENSTNNDWTRAVEEEQYCSVREVPGRGCLKDIATGTAYGLGVSICKRGASIKEI